MKKLKSISVRELLTKEFTQEESDRQMARFVQTEQGKAEMEELRKGLEFPSNNILRDYMERKELLEDHLYLALKIY